MIATNKFMLRRAVSLFLFAMMVMVSGCATYRTPDSAVKVGNLSKTDHPFTNAERDQQIMSLLLAKKFSELDDLLSAIERTYESDPLKEREVDLAFDAFYRASPNLEPLLSAWVNAKPNSSVAYLARGVHLTRMGWAKRGTQYVSQTKEGQFDDMSSYFERALEDLRKAGTLNEKLLHPLVYEIEILMNFQEVSKVRQRYEEALKKNPLSLTARWYYISTLLPRWGGSIGQIHAEVELARPYMEKNEALKILNGRIYAEQGDQELFRGNHLKAAANYNMALMSGDHWFYIGQKGEALTKAHSIEEAKQALGVAMELRPNFPRVKTMMAMSEYYLGHFDKAIELFSTVVEENPYDHKALDIRGDCYVRLRKFSLALADFEQAVKLNPENNEYIKDRYNAEIQLLLAAQSTHK